MNASGIGEVIAANYHLADVIAVGGSGTVYRAERRAFGDTVALKLMHAEHPEGDAERMRFSREAAVLQKLEHPNVVRVLDYGHSESGVPFLVFPLLKGRTLEERIAADGALDWNETGRLALQVLAALDRAHALGIVHRDIKPANIFLTPSMLGEQVQLLDFGLARAVRGGLEVEVTRTGAVVGTPRYMAPEQVRGEQVGQTADIYSFGLVLAEMLTAKPVCTAERELEIYMTHGSDRALDLPVEVLRSPFATVIRRAVAKPLEVRYRLASQMLADVRSIVEMLIAGMGSMPSADMEATFIVNPKAVQPLSVPTEMSEKLRHAFNAMARKADADEPPPTLRQAEHLPEALGSVPIMLTQQPLDEVDTMRMERPAAFKQDVRIVGVPEAPTTVPYSQTLDDEATLSDPGSAPPPAPQQWQPQHAYPTPIPTPLPPGYMTPIPTPVTGVPPPGYTPIPTPPPFAPGYAPGYATELGPDDFVKPTGRARVAIILTAMVAVLFALAYVWLEH